MAGILCPQDWLAQRAFRSASRVFRAAVCYDSGSAAGSTGGSFEASVGGAGPVTWGGCRFPGTSLVHRHLSSWVLSGCVWVEALVVDRNWGAAGLSATSNL